MSLHPLLWRRRVWMSPHFLLARLAPAALVAILLFHICTIRSRAVSFFNRILRNSSLHSTPTVVRSNQDWLDEYRQFDDDDLAGGRRREENGGGTGTRRNSPCFCEDEPNGDCLELRFDERALGLAEIPSLDNARHCGGGRGSGSERIFSYSLFGDETKKWVPLVERNLDLTEKLFPGYKMRVYHDLAGDDPSTSDLRELQRRRNGTLQLCGIRATISRKDLPAVQGTIWRHAALAQGFRKVSEVHFRDLDSPLSEREAAAIKDWRDNSTAKYHVMRDHPRHDVAVVGGLYGVRLVMDNEFEMRRAFQKMVTKAVSDHQTDSKRKSDQCLLARYLWPTFKRGKRALLAASKREDPAVVPDLVAHDSYTCFGTFSHLGNRPFPTKRRSGAFNFVGSNGGEVTKTCPLECRPKKHQDWITC